MKKFYITLLLIFLSIWSVSAKELYNLLSENIFLQIDPIKNHISEIASVKIKINEKTNFVKFKLNGNLYVTSVENGNGNVLRYIQDDTQNFTLMVKFDEVLKIGDEITIKIVSDGCFAKLKYDFFKEMGKKYYSYVGENRILLFGESFWFPESMNFFDRAKYNLQITMPTGFIPISQLNLTDSIDLGLNKTYIFNSKDEIYPPTFLAGRFLNESFKTSGINFSLFYEEKSRNLEKLKEIIRDFVSFLNQNYGFIPYETIKIVVIDDKIECHFGMKDILIISKKDVEKINRKEILAKILLKLSYQNYFFSIKKIIPEMLWAVEGISYFPILDFLSERFGGNYTKDLLTILAVRTLKYNSELNATSAYLTGLSSQKYDSLVVSKSAWIFYMFSEIVGKKGVKKLLMNFKNYTKENILNNKNFENLIRTTFMKDYSWFFKLFAKKTLLPEFKLKYVIFRLSKGGFLTEGEIKCNLEEFKMPVELLFKNKGKDEKKIVNLKGKRTKFKITTKTEPLEIVFDPDGKILKETKNLKIKLFFINGDELFSEGKYLEAISEYKKVLEEYRYSSLANYKIALSLYKMGNYDSALDSFRLAVDGDGNPPWVITMSNLYIGMIYDILGQRERAIAQYKKVLNSKDNSHGAITLASKYLKEPFKKDDK